LSLFNRYSLFFASGGLASYDLLAVGLSIFARPLWVFYYCSFFAFTFASGGPLFAVDQKEGKKSPPTPYEIGFSPAFGISWGPQIRLLRSNCMG